MIEVDRRTLREGLDAVADQWLSESYAGSDDPSFRPPEGRRHQVLIPVAAACLIAAVAVPTGILAARDASNEAPALARASRGSTTDVPSPITLEDVTASTGLGIRPASSSQAAISEQEAMRIAGAQSSLGLAEVGLVTTSRHDLEEQTTWTLAWLVTSAPHRIEIPNPRVDSDESPSSFLAVDVYVLDANTGSELVSYTLAV